MIHSLTDRSVERRTATCSVDGPVSIRPSGTGWVCAEKAKANVRASLRRSSATRDRSSHTEHTLSWKDPDTRTGLCAVCSSVTIVPFGRGWACPNGTAASRRIHHQVAPARYCDACRLLDGSIIWLSAEGCVRCLETDVNAMLAQDAADRRLLGDDWAEAGLHVVGMADPYAMPELESAVPGWKTLGART